MSEKKKQHVVPKIYLKWFCNKKWLLNFFDKQTWEYKEQTPEKVWRINHFYTLFWKNWEKDFTIEDFFWKEIENDIWKVFSKIENKEFLLKDDKDKLAKFITFQFLRTEVFRNWVNKDIKYDMEWNHSIICSNDEYLNAHINKYEEKTWEIFPLSKDEYKNIYKNYELKISNTPSLKSMIELSNKLYPLFRNKNWYFFISPDNSNFITSDNPFFTINISNKKSPFGSWWFLNKSLWSYITITKNICLHFDWNLIKWEWNIIYTKIDRNSIKSYNSLIASCSYRYIIWKDRKLIESIIKRTNIQKNDFYDPYIISWPLWVR